MTLSRIVVRLPNWLGDLLMSRPALHALRVRYPRAELRALTTPGLATLAAWEAGWSTVDGWPAPSGDREECVQTLRRWQPDAALVLPPSFSSAWWMRRTRARIRVGYRGEGRALLLTRAPRRVARGSLHLAAEYLNLVRWLAGDVPPSNCPDEGSELSQAIAALPSLRVPERGRERAAELLEARGVRGRFAVIGPGAIYGPAKRWRPERFATVGRGLAAAGMRILACGVRAEQDACLEVARGVEGAFSLAGETDLETQAALCASAALVVSNDSGLGHLAAATGVPTLSIFGSTSSAWTAPIGPRVRIVQDAPVCAPCFQRTCEIGYRCLEAVSAERVLAACRELLAA